VGHAPPPVAGRRRLALALALAPAARRSPRGQWHPVPLLQRARRLPRRRRLRFRPLPPRAPPRVSPRTVAAAAPPQSVAAMARPRPLAATWLAAAPSESVAATMARRPRQAGVPAAGALKL
jgi:hypothetical protein